MAGELWTRKSQVGKETTYGTAVAATRVVYLDNPMFQPGRAPRPHRFATGTRDNVREYTQGPEAPGATLAMPLSASELVEWLLIGVKGSVTPATPFAGVYVWTFTPGTSLDSLTLQLNDGAVSRKLAGCYADQIRIRGAVNGPNTVEVTLQGTSITAQALTGSLTERTPDFLEGWEAALAIDAFGATPGTTPIAGTLLSWDVLIRNGLGRKYTADNVNSQHAAVIGELDVSAQLLFEAAAAQASTEYGNWAATNPTKRMVRLTFGNNVTIASTYKRTVTVDIPGAWSAVDLGQADAGTRAYRFSYGYVYDPTLAAGVQIICTNARATAW